MVYFHDAGIKVVRAGVKGHYTIDELIQHFGAMADCATSEGLRATLKAIPLLDFSTVKEAWQVLKGANRPTPA